MTLYKPTIVQCDMSLLAGSGITVDKKARLIAGGVPLNLTSHTELIGGLLNPYGAYGRRFHYATYAYGDHWFLTIYTNRAEPAITFTFTGARFIPQVHRRKFVRHRCYNLSLLQKVGALDIVGEIAFQQTRDGGGRFDKVMYAPVWEAGSYQRAMDNAVKLAKMPLYLIKQSVDTRRYHHYAWQNGRVHYRPLSRSKGSTALPLQVIKLQKFLLNTNLPYKTAFYKEKHLVVELLNSAGATVVVLSTKEDLPLDAENNLQHIRYRLISATSSSMTKKVHNAIAAQQNKGASLYTPDGGEVPKRLIGEEVTEF